MADSGADGSGPDQVRIGWREWVALPDLGIPWVKAKVDTGARTSALTAQDVEVSGPSGSATVAFTVHPWQRIDAGWTRVQAPLREYRSVRSSTGGVTERPVIITTLSLAGLVDEVELTLVDRSDMGFRMLLGREALRGRFVIHPGRSYLGGRPDRQTIRANRGR